MKRKKIVLRKAKSSQLNKALLNIEDTLNDIDAKLLELRELDKGSKLFVFIGYLLIGLGGGGSLTAAVFYRSRTSLIDILSLFGFSFFFILLVIGGYTLAHKGLTGDWL